MLRQKILAIAATAALAAMITAPQADAKTLRIAYGSDALSMDSMADWHALTLSIGMYVYDPLLDYEVDVGFIPRLATRWEQVEPTRWRFWLREGVTFHDGSPFTADDVVFSINRMASDNSRGRMVVRRSLDEVVKVDDYTVDIITTHPDPLLINQFNTMIMMSKSWSEEHDSVEPADVTKDQVTFATTNANGTGPYMLESREPGTKTVMVKNPDWYGWDDHPSNVDEVVITPISSDGTRLAALISGDVDFIVPVPMQDVERVNANPGTKVMVGQEARGVFFGMDVSSDEMAYGDVKGANPFSDVRVRKAVAQAIDMATINRVVFRSKVQIANMIIPPGVIGYDSNIPFLPYDPDASRALLAEAGYPDGFEVTLDCSSGRDVGDREICEAVLPMLARVGINVELNAQPTARWWGQISSGDTSFYRMSWGNNGWSGDNTLNDLLACPEEGVRSFNSGGYCNPELDALIDEIEATPTLDARQELQAKAWAIVKEDVPLIPLHYAPLLWGTKENIDVKMRGEGRVYLPYVVMN